MVGWLPSGQGEAYISLRRQFDLRPFTSAEAARALEVRPLHANVLVSRLVRAGWLLRLGRGTMVLSDPEVLLAPELPERLGSLRSRCFYPMLQRATGEVLRIYSGRLIGIALLSSPGDEAISEGDVELLVLVERLADDPVERALEVGAVSRAVSGLMSLDFKRHHHVHTVQVRSVTPRALRRSGSLLLGAARSARILWDPERRLEAILGQPPRRHEPRRNRRSPRRAVRPPRTVRGSGRGHRGSGADSPDGKRARPQPPRKRRTS